MDVNRASSRSRHLLSKPKYKKTKHNIRDSPDFSARVNRIGTLRVETRPSEFHQQLTGVRNNGVCNLDVVGGERKEEEAAEEEREMVRVVVEGSGTERGD